MSMADETRAPTSCALPPEEETNADCDRVCNSRGRACRAAQFGSRGPQRAAGWADRRGNAHLDPAASNARAHNLGERAVTDDVPRATTSLFEVERNEPGRRRRSRWTR
eukprot:6994406-Prymnesium_polylepis.2